MSQPPLPFRFSKDPKDNLAYAWNWTKWLAGDTLATSTWTADAGLSIGTGAFAPTFMPVKATVWLSGGLAGSSYKVTNYITTNSSPPASAQRSFYIDCGPL